jgi:eukaryotic-like serine/threonine-protein kinase
MDWRDAIARARAAWHRTGSAPAVEAPASATGDRRSDPVEPGQRIGRYTVEATLGRGTMGAVYRGRDPRDGAPVAIKTMALARAFEPADLADARERFMREAATATRLKHRDIVEVREAGEDEGLAYIAMEYVRGGDLLAHARADRLLPVVDVLCIGARVALALGYAHTQGVVHRDMKPANVLIDPTRDLIKVTDFGIARIADASRTRTGLVLGTPAFMAPELLAGAHVDGRADLYALGVTLFQLLTGELPHRSASMGELLREIAREPAPDIRTLRPALPKALADAIALALEKRPELRYADGAQMASDLAAMADRIAA